MQHRLARRLPLGVVLDVADHRHQVVGRLAGVLKDLAGGGPVLHTGQQRGVECQQRVHRRAQGLPEGVHECLARLQVLRQRLSLGLKLRQPGLLRLQRLPVLPAAKPQQDQQPGQPPQGLQAAHAASPRARSTSAPTLRCSCQGSMGL